MAAKKPVCGCGCGLKKDPLQVPPDQQKSQEDKGDKK